MKLFYYILTPILFFLAGTNLVHAFDHFLDDRRGWAAFSFFVFALTLSVGIYNLIYLVNNY